MFRKLAFAVIVPVVLAVVASCSGSPTPGSSSSASGARPNAAGILTPVGGQDSSADVAPSGGVTPGADAAPGPGVLDVPAPPDVPATALLHSSAGASAFAVYFYRVLGWSLQVGDSSLLTRVSASSCAMCNAYVGDLQSLAKNHERIQGSSITVLDAQVLPGPAEQAIQQQVKISYVQESYVIIAQSGPVGAALPQQSPTVVLTLTWTTNQWKVSQFTLNG
jgi:hypothetical protein